jgi:hypothetical protein
MYIYELRRTVGQPMLETGSKRRAIKLRAFSREFSAIEWNA